MGTSLNNYALQALPLDACWALFREFAFPEGGGGGGGGEAYPILNELGKAIVKKCGGIPLAAKALGSLLSCHRYEREWLNVLRSEIWDLRGSSILSALGLSVSNSEDGRIAHCGVHDLIHDLAYSVSNSVSEKLDLEQSLYQLVHLDLRGGLKIKQLENARNYVPDVCLEYKQLHTLSLSWGDDNEGKVGRNAPRQDPQRNHSHNAENLINRLIPNRNLSVLRINGYSGTMFPQWFNKLMLLNLTKQVLVNCRKCETLPTLGQLQFLKYLEMEGMDEVVKIADEFYGREGKTKPFPSLIELILKDIPNLRSWDGVDSLEIFPCLQKLSIIKCPRLISMPRFPLLEHLNMHDCDDKVLWSVSELNSLSAFVIDVCPLAYFIPRALLSNNSNLTLRKISSCPKFNTLPATIGTLTSLRSLSICFCEVLENLPREMLNLTNLENLKLIECPSLISLPDESIQGLKSLGSLSIENCSSLASLPLTLGNLTALEHLTIMYCPNLAYLPDVVHEFQALHSLNIFDCISLESLPSGLGRVSSLHNLAIRGCPEIKELPDWIGNLVSLRSLAISECENIKLLPDGMQRLQELQHLSIRDCPDLEVTCRKDTGEDWHKISHIPFKYVGSSNAAASSSSS
ncbi:hypothetical protein BUALT_Bualt03G0202800 [Buddleja alternifolia]|uniref:R13L1/DRL21-like LRR repeat region domain-containing protein n=1 Tax=Buddleja alternifolia TaxID=168488 RepID=A0AAV6XX30_9LAMI|nr:hypothetical protein BUALT_Bualt03G0202800 [Buddleja alternifolia]